MFSGVVFCVGGRGASGDPFRSIECYDLRRDRWFPVADMSTRRRHVGVVATSGLFSEPGLMNCMKFITQINFYSYLSRKRFLL